MYNFSILVPEKTIEDDMSFEELDIDAAEFTTPDIDVEETTVTLCDKYLADYRKASNILFNVKKHIEEKGCTKEIVQLMNHQLVDHGIVLEEGFEKEAIQSIESLADSINFDKIKETLMKILDAIISLVQKFMDQNRSDVNTIKDLLRGKLSDTSKVDTMKFAGLYGSIYKYDDFIAIAKGISGINLESEVSGKEDASDSISTKIKGIFKTAGYVVTKDDVERDPNFIIRKEQMKDIGWEPYKVRTAAEITFTMLEAVRRSHRKAIDVLKKSIKDSNNEAEITKLEFKLKNSMKTIAVIERISLVLSKQVISLTGLFKDKGDVSTEGLEVSEEGKKPCKKKNHVDGCPCTSEDATSCECECLFEEEE